MRGGCPMITQAELERARRLWLVMGIPADVRCYRWPAHLVACKVRLVRLLEWLALEPRLDLGGWERRAFHHSTRTSP